MRSAACTVDRLPTRREPSKPPHAPRRAPPTVGESSGRFPRRRLGNCRAERGRRGCRRRVSPVPAQTRPSRVRIPLPEGLQQQQAIHFGNPAPLSATLIRGPGPLVTTTRDRAGVCLMAFSIMLGTASLTKPPSPEVTASPVVRSSMTIPRSLPSGRNWAAAATAISARSIGSYLRPAMSMRAHASILLTLLLS